MKRDEGSVASSGRKLDFVRAIGGAFRLRVPRPSGRWRVVGNERRWGIEEKDRRVVLVLVDLRFRVVEPDDAGAGDGLFIDAEDLSPDASVGAAWAFRLARPRLSALAHGGDGG